jgi:hypothetical protein
MKLTTEQPLRRTDRYEADQWVSIQSKRLALRLPPEIREQLGLTNKNRRCHVTIENECDEHKITIMLRRPEPVMP